MFYTEVNGKTLVLLKEMPCVKISGTLAVIGKASVNNSNY